MNDGDGTLAAKAQGRQFGPLGTALVIIPTYNEAENIKSIVGRVREAVPEAHVLVADDNSPDGTGKLADELAAEDDHVQVLHRKGKVKRQLKDRAYRYRPVFSRQSAVRQAVGDMLDRFFGGSADSLVLNLVETRHLTPEKLAQIQKLLEHSREEQDGND